MNDRTSLRVDGSSRKAPSMVLVTMDTPGFSTPRVVILRNEANLKQSFMMILPMGESLVNGNARLPLQPKSPAPGRAALHGGQK